MTNGISSGTVEVQCSDLTGLALDWAVAKAVGWTVNILPVHTPSTTYYTVKSPSGLTLRPSTDWEQVGPLIVSQQINLEWDGVDGKALWWKATHQDIVQFQMGETPLIAACRAIVAAHLGEVVSVPAELVENK